MITATSMKKRKRAGTHLGAAGAAAGHAPAVGAPMPKATSTPKVTPAPNTHPWAVRKPAGKGKKKKQVVQCTSYPPVAPSPSLLDESHEDNNGATNVFDDIPGRYKI
jgi:hypothetical protein